MRYASPVYVANRGIMGILSNRHQAGTPNAWYYGNRITIDVRPTPNDAIARLCHRLNDERIVSEVTVSPNRQSLRITLKVDFVIERERKLVADIYHETTGQALVFGHSPLTPKVSPTGNKPRYGSTTSRGSSGDFWFWAWLVSIWPSKGDDN